MPSNNRITVPINLVHGKDDDLIQWITSFPTGHRNQNVKSVLRLSLFDDYQPPEIRVVPKPPQVDSAEMEQLRNQVQTLEQQLAETTAQLEVWSQEFIGKMPEYVANLVQKHMVADGVQMTETTIQESERITDEKVKKRTNNLRKQKW